ncbi:MAG TPA: sigma-54 dependent transcriptional regulator [Vicinamibacterales bacterium]|nr:sigma-54 dependent transcriptional regulator [Vicinamibacterales bacterium]
MGALRFLGESDVARALENEVAIAARSDAKVLITGESGVGKEIAGQLIHALSSRARGPMITINCAGVPDSLLESELFGHMRGSFTDAYRDQRGWLEQADGGTVFMDEIGEMSLRMQALLLRFFESGEIQRVGSDRRNTRVNVRLVAATNRNLLERIAANEFREDLYYRLNVIHIEIPPLRARRDDIPSFIAHFVNVYAQVHAKSPMTVDPAALQALQAYQWPGNVRELKNLVERTVVRARKSVIELADLPQEVVLATSKGAAFAGRVTQVDRVGYALDRMTRHGDDFWSAVHGPFMAHDLTREELRNIVSHGLTQTKGSYRLLVEMFHMPQSDYRRFLSFLRKHDCNMPFQRYRLMGEPASPVDASRVAMATPGRLGAA